MRTIRQILETAGYETSAYSGSGMYGEECLSVTVERSPFKLFSDVLDALSEESDADVVNEEIGAVSKAFRGAREDSMGRSTVVYFPRIAFEK